jgi:hypothetical protein
VIESVPSRPVGDSSDLGEEPADIVHLVGTHLWVQLHPAGLRRSLRQLRTRLLVLQGDSANHPFALDLGHRLLDLGGPTTLVVSTRRGVPEMEPFLRGFYDEILHDQALDRSVARLARGGTSRPRCSPAWAASG